MAKMHEQTTLNIACLVCDSWKLEGQYHSKISASRSRKVSPKSVVCFELCGYKVIQILLDEFYKMRPICMIFLQMALQPGVGLGLLYNMPPGLSVPCSLSLHSFTPIFLRSMDTSSSYLILGLPVHLAAYSFPYNIFFWDFGVLHSLYMAEPSYSLAFNKPDNVLSLDYGF